MILILATGSITDTLHQTHEEREKWITDGCPMSTCTVIPDAYFYLDSRNSMSRLNRSATQSILEAKNDVILIVPDEGMIDKRVRNKAIVLKIKPFDVKLQ